MRNNGQLSRLPLQLVLFFFNPLPHFFVEAPKHVEDKDNPVEDSDTHSIMIILQLTVFSHKLCMPNQFYV